MHLDIVNQVRRTITKMATLGGKLCAIKLKLRHGAWGPWVKRNLHFTIRTATRYMQVYHHRDDPSLSDDPAEFLRQVYGNEMRQIEDESDVEGKSDVNVRDDNSDKESYDSEDSEAEPPSSRSSKIPQEEYDGMIFVKNLARTLDTYLDQPIAESLKLRVLVHVYGILAARLEPIAKKNGLTLEQALGHEYRKL